MERIIHIENYNNVVTKYLKCRDRYNNALRYYGEAVAGGYDDEDIRSEERSFRKAQDQYLSFMRQTLETIFATPEQPKIEVDGVDDVEH